jgi:uncharacterized YkwD family protein
VLFLKKKKFFVLILSLFIIFAASCTQQQKPVGGVESSVTRTGNIERVKVTADKASVRTGCSNDTPALQTSDKDSTYDVLGQVSDWYGVKLPNNQIGFVQNNQCKPVVVEDKKPNVNPQTSGSAPQQGSTAPTAPKTPSAQTNSSTLTAEEQQMVKLVNDARAQNGVPPLQVDMQLTNVARIKAQDMIDNNYFSHNSPKYGSPFDMMRDFGIKYVQAGENIAGNQNVQDAQNALMNSPGHRQNILNPDYTHIGIGIKKGGPYGNMFSQMFVSKPK